MSIPGVSPASLRRAAAGSSSSPIPVRSTVQSSSRHSLYGNQDRVVLDLGSTVWRVGFSAESAPRAVFDVSNVWGVTVQDERRVYRNVKKWLRRVFYDELMIDPKARKVILLENPMLPIRTKQIIATILFDVLQVPSLSFASSPLCALLSLGRITGLVVDVGNLESSVLPIYSSRPLFSHIRTTPLASRHLSIHLHELLRRYAIYIPSVLTSSSKRTLVNPVPDEILTSAVVEEIKTRACFVELDLPSPSGSSAPSTQAERKALVRINSDLFTADPPSSDQLRAHLDARLSALRNRYFQHAPSEGEEDRRRPSSSSLATDLSLRLQGGTLSVPGWLRHACTDIFFDSVDDPDLPSLPECILDCLLKLPIDLRKLLISNILVSGGGSMLPGFPLQLSITLQHLLLHDKRYTSLRGLARHVYIINCPSTSSTSSRPSGSLAASSSAMSVLRSDSSSDSSDTAAGDERDAVAFAWERSLLPWIGASLIGAMKVTGKEEWRREAWDGAVAALGSNNDGGSSADVDIGDWSRRGW